MAGEDDKMEEGIKAAGSASVGAASGYGVVAATGSGYGFGMK